jgi:hypothetical protein
MSGHSDRGGAAVIIDMWVQGAELFNEGTLQ